MSTKNAETSSDSRVLSLDEWISTVERCKEEFRKTTGKSATGVFLGQVEGQLLKVHLETLTKRKLVVQVGNALFLSGMRVVGTNRQFGIVPTFWSIEQWNSNPYQL